MISLCDAIQEIHKELIKSEQKRIQSNLKALFIAEKLTIELSCVFSENSSSDKKGSINAFSILALDAETAKSISSEKIQKITLEFKTLMPDNGTINNQNSGEADIPKHTLGIYHHE